MNQKIIIALRELKPELQRRYGVEKFAIFGSVARGEDTEESDVDIAILQESGLDYFDLIDLKTYLENKLQKSVDIGFFDSMRTFIKNRIEKDFIYV